MTNVFDTQVAAGFLGLGNQEGYESLVRKVLKVRLKGAEGFTRWDRRPLTAQQLEYAADDARLLLSLGDALESGLEQRGRLEWAARSAGRSRRSPTSAIPTGCTAAPAPRPARRPRPRSGARARGGREHAARALDRPASTVLPDQALIGLARRAPKDLAPSSRSVGCRPQTLHRRGDHLLEAIALAAAAAPRRPHRPSRPSAIRATPARLARAGTRKAPLDRVRRGRRADRHPVRAGHAGLRAAARPRRATRGGARLAGLVGEELEELVAGRLSLRVGRTAG